jgi:hypothetical protein
VARGTPCDSDRTRRRIPRDEHRAGEHELDGFGARGALLRLDRRRSPQPQQRELRDSVYAAQARQHLEHAKPPLSRRADPRRTDDSRRSRCFRGETATAHRRLLIRATAASAPRSVAGAALSRSPQGVGVLQGATVFVPADGDPLGVHRSRFSVASGHTGRPANSRGRDERRTR